MGEKGYSFVREPGISAQERRHMKEEQQPMRQMQASQPKDDAHERLARHHDTMVGLWGENYHNDPRYHDALSSVRKGRQPTLVLADFQGY